MLGWRFSEVISSRKPFPVDISIAWPFIGTETHMCATYSMYTRLVSHHTGKRAICRLHDVDRSFLPTFFQNQRSPRGGTQSAWTPNPLQQCKLSPKRDSTSPREPALQRSKRYGCSGIREGYCTDLKMRRGIQTIMTSSQDRFNTSRVGLSCCASVPFL